MSGPIAKALSAQLAHDPAVAAVVRGRAQQALVRARLLGLKLEEGKAYADSVWLANLTLYSTHPDARAIEYGARDRKPAAPLRRASIAVGARVVTLSA